jgi:hypothetical protein
MRRFPIRKFNEQGLQRFAKLIDEATQRDRTLSASEHRVLVGKIDDLVEDPKYAEKVAGEQYIEAQAFDSRRKLADYLCPKIDKVGLRGTYRAQSGLWAWIAACWFEQLTPPDSGSHFVGARERYVVAERRKDYRHLVFGPCIIFKTHSSDVDRAMLVLSGKPHVPGEIVGQIASKKIYQRAPSVLSLATYLFYDSTRRTFVKDSTVLARRLSDVMSQFGETFDVRSMTLEQLIELLPKQEFSGLVEAARTRATH